MTDKKKNLYYLDELSDYKVASDDPDVRGWDVKDADNRVIGKVDNLLVSKKKEKVVYLDVEVDKSILDDNHKPYRKSASDDVHEFINKDGENHIIVPVGLVRLNEDDKFVYTDKINRQTFSETKRKKKGANVDREYETVVLESYERGRTTVDTSARPRTDATGSGRDTTTAGAGAAAAGRETSTSGSGTGTAGTGRDTSGTGKSGTGRDTGTPTTGTAGTGRDTSTTGSTGTGRDKSSTGSTGTGRDTSTTGTTGTGRDSSTTGSTGTGRDTSTTGTTGTGRDKSSTGSTGTGRDTSTTGTTGTERDSSTTGSTGTGRDNTDTGSNQSGTRRTGGAGTGPDAQGVRNEQTSQPGDRDLEDGPQNRHTNVTADNNDTVGRRSTDTDEDDSFYDRDEFDRTNYRQRKK